MAGLNDIFRNFINNLKGGDNFMLRSTGSEASNRQRQQQIYDMIAKKAYELYEKRNSQHGRDMDDWLEAERLVKRSLRSR